MSYSVLMSVYAKDNPLFFDAAIQSMMNQSLKTDDFVIVCDGQLTDNLNEILKRYTKEYPNLFNIVVLEKNQGLGIALATGLLKCKNSLVARMDADDISLPNRCEMQVNYLENNPSIDIVGGQIIEFLSDTKKIVSSRIVKTKHEDILKIAKKKSPMNHVTVMFKKEAVLNSGNYQHLQYNEDYYLWTRMLMQGCKFSNIDEILVYVRINGETFLRKRGMKYFKAQKKIFTYLKNEHFITFPRYCCNIFIRFVSSILPNKVRTFLFMKLMRKKEKGSLNICI